MNVVTEKRDRMKWRERESLETENPLIVMI